MLLLSLAFSLGADVLAGSKVIDDRSIKADLFTLSRHEMLGRDSPSAALSRAAEMISERYASIGLVPAADAKELLDPYLSPEAGEAEPASRPNLYLRPFTRGLEAPVEEECSFVFTLNGEEHQAEFGVDWVPVLGCAGALVGELEFAGFGIQSSADRYDDFAAVKDLKGKVAVIVAGEPRHKRKFEGPEVSKEASLWQKLHELNDAGVSGVIVVRRDAPPPKGKRPDFEPLLLDYRYTHATFPQVTEPRPPRRRPAVVEVSSSFAERLTGVDLLEVASKVDRSGTPKKVTVQECSVKVRSSLRLQDVRIDNVVGVLPGADPVLAEEFVVIGAHYDHIGVDTRGRVGPGADDNASGTSGIMAVAAAMKVSAPKRSVIFCAFGAEEDGLLGSKAFCGRLPVPRSSVVAMINMDMVGRGDAGEVAVLGTNQNPALLDVLKRANKLGKTGIKDLVTGKGDELWRRSDHYPFHQLGIPSLFFFEGLPISRNPDYHTWRDRVELVDPKKIENTSKLVHQTAWLLANDESRPPSPSSRR